MAGYVLHALSLHLIQDFDNTRIICALVLRLKQHNIRMIPGYADILDEATASIDPENEHLIQEAISALTHGKTIITIAHRLATIENADQILVIDGGTVAQRGTHKELLQQEGTYKKFIQIREQAEGWRIQ